MSRFQHFRPNVEGKSWSVEDEDDLKKEYSVTSDASNEDSACTPTTYDSCTDDTKTNDSFSKRIQNELEKKEEEEEKRILRMKRFYRKKNSNSFGKRCFRFCACIFCCEFKFCFLCCVLFLTVTTGALFFGLFQTLEFVERSSKVSDYTQTRKEKFDELITQSGFLIDSSFRVIRTTNSINYETFQSFSESLFRDQSELISSFEMILRIPEGGTDNDALLTSLDYPSSSINDSVNYSLENLDLSKENSVTVHIYEPSDAQEESVYGNVVSDDSFRSTLLTYSTNDTIHVFSKSDSKDLYMEVIEMMGHVGGYSGYFRVFLNMNNLLDRLIDEELYEYSAQFNNYNSIEDEEEQVSSPFWTDKSFTKVMSGSASEITITLKPTSSNRSYGSSYKSTKIFLLFLPFIVLLFTCCCCLATRFKFQNHMKNKKMKMDRRLAQDVSFAIREMDFTHPALKRLRRKRKKGEKGTIVRSLQEIDSQVRKIKKFLPQTLLKQIEYERERRSSTTYYSESFHSSSVHSSSTGSRRSRNSSRNRRNTDGYDSETESTGSFNSISKNAIENCNIDKSFLGNVVLKPVVVMSVSLTGLDRIFEKYRKYNQLKEFREIYIQYICTLLRIVRTYGGDFHYFDSHSVLFSWNAICAASLFINKNNNHVINVNNCERKAVSAALEIANDEYITEELEKEFKLRLRIGIAKGDSLVGNYEISQFDILQFGIIGNSAMYTAILRDMVPNFQNSSNNHYESCNCILINEEMYDAVKYVVNSYVVDFIRLGNSKPQKVYSVLGMKNEAHNETDYVKNKKNKDNKYRQKDDEWLYEIEGFFNSEMSTPCTVVEEVWDVLIKGMFAHQLDQKEKKKKRKRRRKKIMKDDNDDDVVDEDKSISSYTEKAKNKMMDFLGMEDENNSAKYGYLFDPFVKFCKKVEKHAVKIEENNIKETIVDLTVTRYVV